MKHSICKGCSKDPVHKKLSKEFNHKKESKHSICKGCSKESTHKKESNRSVCKGCPKEFIYKKESKHSICKGCPEESTEDSKHSINKELTHKEKSKELTRKEKLKELIHKEPLISNEVIHKNSSIRNEQSILEEPTRKEESVHKELSHKEESVPKELSHKEELISKELTHNKISIPNEPLIKETQDCFGRYVLVNNTIFVDPKFGINHKAEANNANKPFRTIRKALQAVQRYNPNKNNIWVINVSPGIFDEDIIIPTFVNINGIKNATTINSVIFNGNNSMENFIIKSRNKTGITTKSDVVKLYYVYHDSVWTTKDSAGPSLNSLGTKTILTNCDINMTSSSSISGKISNIHSESYIKFTDTDCKTVINGNADLAIHYDIVANSGTDAEQQTFTDAKLEISGGTTSFNILGSVEESDLINLVYTPPPAAAHPRATAIIIGTQINFPDLSSVKVQQNKKVLAKALGNSALQVTNTTVSTGSSTTTNVTSLQSSLILAEGVPTSTEAPNILFHSTSFPDTLLPPTTGTFNNIIFHASDIDGSLRSTGGLYNNVTEITSDYTLTSKDHTIRALQSGITITLPPPSTIIPGPITYGNLKMIRNDSTGNIQLSGSIVDPTGPLSKEKYISDGLSSNSSTLTIPPSSAVILYCNLQQWFVMGVA